VLWQAGAVVCGPTLLPSEGSAAQVHSCCSLQFKQHINFQVVTPRFAIRSSSLLSVSLCRTRTPSELHLRAERLAFHAGRQWRGAFVTSRGSSAYFLDRHRGLISVKCRCSHDKKNPSAAPKPVSEANHEMHLQHICQTESQLAGIYMSTLSIHDLLCHFVL